MARFDLFRVAILAAKSLINDSLFLKKPFKELLSFMVIYLLFIFIFFKNDIDSLVERVLYNAK